VTLFQVLFAAEFLDVHVIPSGLVMTRFVPPLDTATNKPPPKVTPYQPLSAADTLDVHVIPSELVITRLPVPVLDTATNNPLP
jgi:hypothetical protein